MSTIIKPYFLPWRRLEHWYKNLKEVYKWLRAFFQRGLRGYSTRDTWGLNTYLLRVYIGGLTNMRDYGISYPANLQNREEWENTLTEMIEGFRAGESWAYFWGKEEDPRKKKFDKAQELLQEYFFTLWDLEIGYATL